MPMSDIIFLGCFQAFIFLSCFAVCYYKKQNPRLVLIFNLYKTLDVDKMKKAAQALVGTHDFASFCGNRHMKKSTVRTIFSIDLVERDGEIEILYCGNGFLQNMVRILTGTLIEVGRGERAPESMPALLKAKERKQAGYTAPPQGLRLEKVTYETMDGRC